jgi:hypothetical protein
MTQPLEPLWQRRVKLAIADAKACGLKSAFVRVVDVEQLLEAAVSKVERNRKAVAE